MAASNPLRAHNRTHLEQPGILKNTDLASKTNAAYFKRGSENSDPNVSSEHNNIKLKGVSRLPVLAKSLLPSQSELSQNASHNRWEQKPLTSKAPKKKPCTKPVPFNLSQSRMHAQRNTNVQQGRPPLARSAQGTHLEKAKKINSSAKTESKATTPGTLRGQAPQPQTGSSAIHHGSQEPFTDLNSCLGRISLLQSNLPEESSQLSKKLFIKIGINSYNQAFQSTHIQPAAKGTSLNCQSAVRSLPQSEVKSEVLSQSTMPRLSTCPAGPGTHNNEPQRYVKQNLLGIECTADKTRLFSPDPSSLRNILQGDGTRLGDFFGAHRVSTCPTSRGTSIYSAQRVPAKKIQKEATMVPKSPTGRTFSENTPENNAGTPYASASLTGRVTSICSAKRIPVRKLQTDESSTVKSPPGGAVSFSPDPTALSSILMNQGIGAIGTTPGRVSICPNGRGTSIYSAQRVPVKKKKPEVALPAASTKCVSQTPVVHWTPQRGVRTKPQSMTKLCTTQKMSSLMSSPGLHTPHDPRAGILVCQGDKDVVQRLFQDQEQDDAASQLGPKSKPNIEDQSTLKDLNPKYESKNTTQPFIQAAHRGSVIVFSSSKKSDQSQEPLKTYGIAAPLQLSKDWPTKQCCSSQFNPDLDWAKPSQAKAHSIALPALKPRHTPLEEIILDDECATYTSRLLSCPLQPRSGNPVATMLLFKDSTCFLPIDLSSPLRLSSEQSSLSIKA